MVESLEEKRRRSVGKKPGDQRFQEFDVGPQFEIRKIIGTGSYGKVAEAIHKPSGKKIAIKKILNIFDDAIDCKRLLREIKLLRMINSNFIVRILDIKEPKDPANFNSLFLFLEIA